MSRIEKLIEELCPDGVEYRPMGEVGVLVRGNGMPKTDFTDSGVGCIHYGQIYTHYGPWATETKSFVAPMTAERLAKVDPGDLVITNTSENHEDVCKAVAWLGATQVVTGGHATVFKHRQDPKFLSYYLQTADFFAKKKKYATGTKVIDVSANSLARIAIPVPPIAVQREIVRILDTFTELEAELEAELEVRRQQYDYYRLMLLRPPGCEHDLPWIALGEIGRVAMCKRVFKEQTAAIGEIPFYKIGTFGAEPDAYVSEALFQDYRRRYSFPKKGDVLLSAAGTIGRIVEYDGRPAYFQDSNIVWLDNDESIVLNRYLYHQYQIVDWSTDGGTIRRLYNENLKAARIPVPPRDEQERVVSKLDTFEALFKSVTVGLPAELAARRRQYEHYRDRLLTFEEAVS